MLGREGRLRERGQWTPIAWEGAGRGDGMGSCCLPHLSKLLRRRNNFSFVFTFNHKIILVPRSLPLGGTFVRDDISLIKCSSSGAWFSPPPPPTPTHPHPQTRTLPAKPSWPPGRPATCTCGLLEPSAPPPCSRAVIDILIRRQEAADQVLPRRGLEAGARRTRPQRRRHVPQQQ